MITAVIQHRKDTLIVDLPRPITDLQTKLLSIGVMTPPGEIRLFGGEDAAVDVQLASSDRVSQHLCRLFCEHNTLAYVNTTAFLIQTADKAIKGDIEDAIYHDRYESASALITDLRDRTMALGTEKLTLYFPLTGNIDEGDHNPFTVGDSFLYDYRYDITQLIEGNMAKLSNCPCLGEKFASAAWTAEVVKGTLYGRVDVRLHEELTEEELDRLKEWITSQNEGACDLIEGQPIDSEDGLLAISLWHGGNDYFVSDRDELDEYIAQQNELRIGGM